MLHRYERIKNLREDNDYKQSDISNILDCDKDRYVKWENGINEIPLEYLVKLSKIYNVNIEYIVGKNDNKANCMVEIFDMKKVGSKIKILRLKNNELQKDLAFVLNCSAGLIYNYENAKNNLTISKAILICEHYNISVDELLI